MFTIFELYGYETEKVNSGKVKEEIIQKWIDV